jgi:hypothetical protein
MLGRGRDFKTWYNHAILVQHLIEIIYWASRTAHVDSNSLPADPSTRFGSHQASSELMSAAVDAG